MKTVLAVIVLLVVGFLRPASAWNIPGHMLSAAIAYQVLTQESQSSRSMSRSRWDTPPSKLPFDVYGHLMEKVNVKSANRLAMTVFGEDRGGSSSETVADSEKRESGSRNLLN
jgi:hypothetical protein